MSDNRAVSLPEEHSVVTMHRYQDAVPNIGGTQILTLSDLAPVFEDEAIFLL